MNSEKFTLDLKVNGPMAEFTSLCISNGLDEIVAEDYHRITMELPKGIYTIMARLNGASVEKVLRLAENMDVEIDAPEALSSIVAPGFDSTADYHLQQLEKYSREQTVASPKTDLNNSLFLLFRYADLESFLKYNPERKNPAMGFSILNSKRQIIHSLDGECSSWDAASGCLSFHARLETGIYYLHYGGISSGARKRHLFEEPREIPLYVFVGFQTRVFMIFSSFPVFSSLRINLHPNSGGVGNFRSSSIIEAALQKFYNGINFFPATVLEELAMQKWDDPTLALVAAYIYYSGKRRDNEGFFAGCLDNLEQLLGAGTPEIVALRVLQAQATGADLPDFQFDEPCMFLAGMKAVLRSAAGSNIVKPAGMAEKVIEYLYDDLVWTSYKPLPLRKAPDRKQKPAAKKKAALEAPPEALHSEAGNTPAGSSPKQPGSKTPKPKLLNSWLANSIIDFVGKKADYDATAMASQLNVTPNLVKKTVNDILNKKDKIIAYHQEKGLPLNADGLDFLRNLK